MVTLRQQQAAISGVLDEASAFFASRCCNLMSGQRPILFGNAGRRNKLSRVQANSLSLSRLCFSRQRRKRRVSAATGCYLFRYAPPHFRCRSLGLTT